MVDNGNNRIDGKKIYRRAIHLCWFLLLVCLVIKMFGYNWFEPYTNNQKILNLFDAIERSFIVKLLINFISSLFCFNLFWLSIYKLKFYKHKKQFYLNILAIFIATCLKMLFVQISLFADVILFFVIPYIQSKQLKRIIYLNIVFILLMLVSNLTKNISLVNYVSDNLLIGLIYSIDIYIMLTLNYLYNTFNDKEDH